MANSPPPPPPFLSIDLVLKGKRRKLAESYMELLIRHIGLSNDPLIRTSRSGTAESMARFAVSCADALLAELEKKSTNGQEEQ